MLIYAMMALRRAIAVFFTRHAIDILRYGADATLRLKYDADYARYLLHATPATYMMFTLVATYMVAEVFADAANTLSMLLAAAGC